MLTQAQRTTILELHAKGASRHEIARMLGISRGLSRTQPHPEEKVILDAVPELAEYVAAVKHRGRKVPGLALRQLLLLVREYPRAPSLAAARSGPLWPVRPGPVGAHDSAPRSSRILSAGRRKRVPR